MHKDVIPVSQIHVAAIKYDIIVNFCDIFHLPLIPNIH